MQHEANTRRGLLPLLLGSTLVAAGCHDHEDHHDGSGPALPVYYESEPNDLVDEANYFGVLFPGDSFLIEADIVDGSFVPADPFDGFAFTAGQPIHVDFLVYVDDPFTELELGLYDPQLDATVGYYLQDGDIIYGGVDVYSGAVDFHLVVESIVGATTYGLEIDVYSLYESEAAPATPAFGELTHLTAKPRMAVQGTRARDGDAGDRFREYGRAGTSTLDEDEPRTVGRIHVIEIDEANQNVRRSTFDLTTR